MTRKLDILKIHCKNGGRSFYDIECTVLGTIKLAPEAMNSTQFAELCQELAEMGFQQVIFNMPNVHEIEPIEIIGQEVMPHIAYMT